MRKPTQLGMLTRSHTLLPATHIQQTAPHFGRYSFPLPQMVGAELVWVAGHKQSELINAGGEWRSRVG